MTTFTLMINGQANYPQIEYTSLDGDKCLRVITQTKPLTKDRELAERGMLMDVKDAIKYNHPTSDFKVIHTFLTVGLY